MPNNLFENGPSNEEDNTNDKPQLQDKDRLKRREAVSDSSIF
jgi:hypothetical protein